MKINVSNRNIEIVSKPDISDIALGYIDNKDIKRHVDIVIDDKFAQDSATQITPYQEIASSEDLFFDENNIPLKVNLKRLGNTWIYEPINSTEYTPANFECDALIKKAGTFSEKNTYNIKICAADQSSNLNLCKKLVNVFGNAGQRGLCPANISVNDNKTEPESMLEYSIENSDFIFLESDDGITLPDKISIEDIIAVQTNAWISVENFSSAKVVNTNEEDKYEPIYKEGRLNNFYVSSKRKAILNKVLTMDNIPEEYTDYEKELLYDDVLLLSKDEKGSIIITPAEFLNDMKNNAAIIFDVMMYIYLKSYVKTKTFYSWITDEPVDYRVYSYMPYGKYHERINIKDLVYDKNSDMPYSIIRVNTNNENVFLVDIDENKELFFRKKGNDIKDPPKKSGEISFLTMKQTIVNYQKENIFYKESRANISWHDKDGKVYIEISPLISSKYHIVIPDSVALSIDDMTKKYWLCATQVEAEQTSDIRLVNTKLYNSANDGIKIAEIIPKIEYGTAIYDIRIKGGGLPESCRDDYDMLDIGNPYGRPYRKGSTLIFRLPKNLMQYRDKIEKEVKKHIEADNIAKFIYDKEES